MLLRGRTVEGQRHNIDAARDERVLHGREHRGRDQVRRPLDLAELFENVRLADDGADDIEALDDVRAQVTDKREARRCTHADAGVPGEDALPPLQLRADGVDHGGRGGGVRRQVKATRVERHREVVAGEGLEHTAVTVDGALDDAHHLCVHPREGVRAEGLRRRVELVKVHNQHRDAALRETGIGVKGLRRRIDGVHRAARAASVCSAAYARHAAVHCLRLRRGHLVIVIAVVQLNAAQDVLWDKAFDVAQLVAQALVRNLHVANFRQGTGVLDAIRLIQRRALHELHVKVVESIRDEETQSDDEQQPGGGDADAHPHRFVCLLHDLVEEL
eukprot:PhM_4_TR4950/c2_g1_i1/m.95898